MPIDVPATWRGVRNRFRDAPDEVTNYFEPIPELVERHPWEVAIAYAFAQLEKAHNRALYIGAAKLHRANTTIARNMVDSQHITRKFFNRLFANVFGRHVPPNLKEILAEAEKVRDKIIHGKQTTEPEKRKVLVYVLVYAEMLDEFIYNRAEFRPFTTDLRGFVGRREPLDQSTSRWLMKGLGFSGTTE